MSLINHLDLKNDGLYWKDTGLRVGCLNTEGYRVFCFKGVQYKEHREIFFIVNGYYPKIIDHINRIKDDNRPENLRETTNSLNTLNQDCKGYKLKRNKYEARIIVNGVRRALGTFNCPTMASLAYLKAKKEIMEAAYGY